MSRLRAIERFSADNGLEPCEDNHRPEAHLHRRRREPPIHQWLADHAHRLATIGESLVDIHGPHDHQSLLHPAKQLAILDAFGDLLPLRAEFAALARRGAELEAEKAALIVDERTYAQQLDLLRHQVNEITAAALRPEEEAQLTQDYQRASNAAKLLELTQDALRLLNEEESSVLARAGAVGRLLQELQRFDPSTTALPTLQAQAVATLNELQAELSHYADRVEIDRHGSTTEGDSTWSILNANTATLAEVIAFGEQAGHKLHQLSSDADWAGSMPRWPNSTPNSGTSAVRFTKRKVIRDSCKAVSQHLADLGFNQCSS